MFDFKATVDIHTTVEKLWGYLIDIEEWWLPSNPEHIELEILSQDKQIDEGTRRNCRGSSGSHRTTVAIRPC